MIYHIPIPCLCCDEVCKGGGCWGPVDTREPLSTAGPPTGYLLCYPECHHCHHPHHPHHPLLGAARCSGRFYTSPVAGTAHFPMCLSAGFALLSRAAQRVLAFPTHRGAGTVGTSHLQNLPRCIQLPLCSTEQEEPVFPLLNVLLLL